MGIGQGYSMVVSYTTSSMVVSKHEIGLVAGLVLGLRNTFFSVLGAIFYAIVRSSHLTSSHSQLISEQYVPKATKNSTKYMIQGALEAGVPEAALPSFLQAFQAVSAGYSDLATLLQMPDVTLKAIQATSAGAIHGVEIAWHFVLKIGIVYFMAVIILAAFTSPTDAYLSKDVWVKLRPRGLHKTVHSRA